LTLNGVLVLGALVAFSFVLNLPFGYQRSKYGKFSLLWFVYIHLPVPFIILSRRLLSLDRSAIPLIIIAAIAGQVLGGKMRRQEKAEP